MRKIALLCAVSLLSGCGGRVDTQADPGSEPGFRSDGGAPNEASAEDASSARDSSPDERGAADAPEACLRMHQRCWRGSAAKCCPDMECTTASICEVPARDAGDE